MLASYPFQNPFLIVMDPEIIEHVTVTNFDNYIKGEMTYSRFGDLLGQGIFKYFLFNAVRMVHIGICNVKSRPKYLQPTNSKASWNQSFPLIFPACLLL